MLAAPPRYDKNPRQLVDVRTPNRAIQGEFWKQLAEKCRRGGRHQSHACDDRAAFQAEKVDRLVGVELIHFAFVGAIENRPFALDDINLVAETKIVLEDFRI